MGLVTPDIGLLIWMLITFSVVVFVLKKMAWKPILKALKDRENSIDSALKSAEKAKEDMEKMQADNSKILEKAQKESVAILREAKDLKDKIINEAKEKAHVEAIKLIDDAKENFRNEKASAINEIKDQIAKISVELAGKILQEKLKDDQNQKNLIENFIKEVKLN